MKHYYSQYDIKDGEIDNIPLGTNIMVKMKEDYRKFKGKLCINESNYIKIDSYIDERIGGSYFNKDYMESITIIDNFKFIKNFYKKLIRKIKCK